MSFAAHYSGVFRQDVESHAKLCPKMEVAIPEACYCRFDNIHETTAVVRTPLKKRLMKINEVDSCK